MISCLAQGERGSPFKLWAEVGRPTTAIWGPKLRKRGRRLCLGFRCESARNLQIEYTTSPPFYHTFGAPLRVVAVLSKQRLKAERCKGVAPEGAVEEAVVKDRITRADHHRVCSKGILKATSVGAKLQSI